MSLSGMTPTPTLPPIFTHFNHQILLLDASSSDPQTEVLAGSSSASIVTLSTPDSSRRPSHGHIAISSVAPLLTRKATNLREELARRKYAKWRNPEADRALGAHFSPNSSIHDPFASLLPNLSPIEQGTSSANQPGLSPSSVVDTLHENQRGILLFSRPLFSSRTLLNLDPAPFSHPPNDHASPYTPATYQLPNPTSWRWAWPRWYVDMSTDVDDEGWSYSLGFDHRWGWHGVPIWFCSFVRRRRWIRKRTRRYPSTKDIATETPTQFRHHSNPPTSPALATPYSPVLEPSSSTSSSSSSSDTSTTKPQGPKLNTWPALQTALHTAHIDRERLLAISYFTSSDTTPNEVLLHLSANMSEIMSGLIFQASRRQLAADLLHAYEAATQDTSTNVTLHNERVTTLRKASEAAESTVRGLEYWSDVRDLVTSGETQTGVDERQGWDPDTWTGIDGSGPKIAGERDLPETESKPFSQPSRKGKGVDRDDNPAKAGAA